MKLIRLTGLKNEQEQIADTYLCLQIKYNTIFYLDYSKRFGTEFLSLPKNIIPKDAKRL